MSQFGTMIIIFHNIYKTKQIHVNYIKNTILINQNMLKLAISCLLTICQNSLITTALNKEDITILFTEILTRKIDFHVTHHNKLLSLL